MAKQTTFATPWKQHDGPGGKMCLSCGTIFAFDICPTCAMKQRLLRLVKE